MLFRGSPTGKQRILQPFGQGNEALSTLNDLGVLPPAVAQPVVVDQMLKRFAIDGNLDSRQLGEVRKAHHPGFIS